MDLGVQMPAFRWLHITDLHQGMVAQDWLWPRVKAKVFDDLGRLHDKAGPWHVIFFTGDLVYSGATSQFEQLNETLAAIYRRLKELGSEPVLAPVPGNHDLSRPPQGSPAATAIASLEDDRELQAAFWQDASSPARQAIAEAFEGYSEWLDSHPFRRPTDASFGVLPGDFAGSVVADGIKVGIVGLNSAFLQWRSGDLFGKLALHPLQLQSTCGESALEWLDSHDISFLMTHHPPDWLDKASAESYDSEIAPPGQFVGHLFGHQHEPKQASIGLGGGKPRRYLQGCALFGLPTWGEPPRERFHGYTAGVVSIEGRVAALSVYPRLIVWRPAGDYDIAPNRSHYALEADERTAPEPFYVEREVPTDTVKKEPPAPPEQLIALGMDTIATGRLLGARGREWTLELRDFLLGDVESITSLAEGFATLDKAQRFVIVNSLGEGRALAEPPVWKAVGDSTEVSVVVEPAFPRKDARQLKMDIDISNIRRGIRGVDRIPQIVKMGLGIQLGELLFRPSAGSRTRRFYGEFPREIFAGLVKIELARLASIPYQGRSSEEAYTPLLCVRKVLDVEVPTDSEPQNGFLDVSIELEVLGVGSWKEVIPVLVESTGD